MTAEVEWPAEDRPGLHDEVHRVVAAVVALVLLSACGHKKVQVKAPAPPTSISSSDLEGIASYYAEPYHGRKTANGETFDTYQGMTAAHRAGCDELVPKPIVLEDLISRLRRHLAP